MQPLVAALIAAVAAADDVGWTRRRACARPSTADAAASSEDAALGRDPADAALGRESAIFLTILDEHLFKLPCVMRRFAKNASPFRFAKAVVVVDAARKSPEGTKKAKRRLADFEETYPGDWLENLFCPAADDVRVILLDYAGTPPLLAKTTLARATGSNNTARLWARRASFYKNAFQFLSLFTGVLAPRG